MEKQPESSKPRGRPVGSIKTTRKIAITLRLDSEALTRWRASGKGWQTRATAILEKQAP